MTTYYSQLISRNWLFISPSLQKKISETRLVFAGCGLGSNIAILAARQGFTKFSLWDGDVVETSNLNRQAYYSVDVGKNKATSLAKYIKQINPKCNVEVHNKYITGKDINNVVRKGDVLINTVNFDQIFFQLLERAQKYSNFVLLPLNIGFGSITIVFHRHNHDFLKLTRSVTADYQMYSYLLTHLKNLKIDRKIFNRKVFTKILKVGYDPQIGIAANLSASLVVDCIFDILSRKKLRVYPYAYQINT